MSVGKDLIKQKWTDHHIEYRRKVVHCRVEFLLILNFKFIFLLPPPSVRCERSNGQTCNYFPSVVKIYFWHFCFCFFILTPDRPIDPFVVLIIASSALWRDWRPRTVNQIDTNERFGEKQKMFCLNFSWFGCGKNVIWCFLLFLSLVIV